MFYQTNYTYRNNKLRRPMDTAVELNNSVLQASSHSTQSRHTCYYTIPTLETANWKEQNCSGEPKFSQLNRENTVPPKERIFLHKHTQ